MTDLEKTKHFSVNREALCGNLKEYIPQNAILVEPFVGEGDLLPLFPNHVWERYDVEQHDGAILQNTLINPPDYRGKWVITNPPYLAKNKAKDKTPFELCEEDDQYKIFLRTIFGCEGGIVIIPTNFFTDERSGKIRNAFLSRFNILRVNFFTKPMFPTTTYTVCSFAFQKKAEIKDETQEIFFNSKPIKLYPQYDYRLGGEIFHEINDCINIFSRAVKEDEKKYMTHIRLVALDTRDEPIHLEWEENPSYGKPTDRVSACLMSEVSIDISLQKKVIESFNDKLNKIREQYGDMILTNYRDYNRKRISFNFAYKLASVCLYEV